MVLQMMKINCDTAQEYYLQQAIKDKMQGFSFSHPKCSATVLLQLAVDLQHLKEEFYNVGKHHLTRNKENVRPWNNAFLTAFYTCRNHSV